MVPCDAVKMEPILRAFDRICLFAICFLLRRALAVNDMRLRLPQRVRRWRGSLRKLWRRWTLAHRPDLAPPFVPRRKRPWNRTPDHIEEEVVRFHVATPIIGAGQLACLLGRVVGVTLTRETIRKIVIRRQDLVLKLTDAEKRRRRKITVSGPRQLWGLDLTLVWVLWFIPVWVLGIVDYHGSRLVAFERLPWPTGAQIARVVENAIAATGAPRRILSDRGPVFVGLDFQLALASHGVEHVHTRPAHPWTNGRIERIHKTFKETVFGLVWMVASTAQLDRFCSDFVRWYNRDRPHSSNGGRTPDEVWRGQPAGRSLGPITYFDGRLRWFRFG